MNLDQCCLNEEHTHTTPGQHGAVTHLCVVSLEEAVSDWYSMVQTWAIDLSTWSMAAPSSTSIQLESVPVGMSIRVAVIFTKDSLLSQNSKSDVSGEKKARQMHIFKSQSENYRSTLQ